ncbi:MAG: lysophospholipase, partial [Planctomycetaceae bacterium]
MLLEVRRRRYGKLDALVVESDQGPKIPVVLCHGYGAPGDDLVANVEVLADWLEASIEQFRFVFPAAPLSPPELAMYGGRAWWEINMAKLLAA